MHPRIAADRDIPFVRECFAGIGDLKLVDGRAVGPSDLVETDVLVVRSVTRVDARLLAGTGVRFVATATSGTDHVDAGYLADRGIAFADAAGCNADAVAEYVISALCVLAREDGFDWQGRSAGIVGHGHVGRAVERRLRALGMKCRVCDPPLQEAGLDSGLVPLSDLADVDVLTLHVPLTESGRHRTRNLVDASLLSGLHHPVVIVNTARGGVVDETALVELLDRRPGVAAVVDVWDREPEINMALLEAARLATAHIAGYSADARLRATRMIHGRVCEFLGLEPDPPDLRLQGADPAPVRIAAPGPDAVMDAVFSGYDIRVDAAALRGLRELSATARPAYFDDLRKSYRMRREFSARSVRIEDAPSARLLAELGFNVVN